VGDEMKLVWKAASGTAPTVTFGTALTAADGWAELPAGGLISTTNGHKITVAMVGKASNLPVAAGNTTVVAKAS
jgi:pectate lyase